MTIIYLFMQDGRVVMVGKCMHLCFFFWIFFFVFAKMKRNNFKCHPNSTRLNDCGQQFEMISRGCLQQNDDLLA